MGKVLVACERSHWTSLHSSPTVRSRTFPGIAHAMAMQWRGFVET